MISLLHIFKSRNLYILLAGAALLLLVSLIYRDYGVSYDEAVHLNNGDWIMVWYGTLGKINSAVTATSSKYYAGLADIITQVLANTGTVAFGWDHFEQRHFITALIGLLGIFYTYRVGNLLGGQVMGGWAALILLLTPRWFGHMFDDPKDIPFATGYVASLFYILQPWVKDRGYDWKLCVKIGFAIGAALGVRIGGVFLYVTLTVSILLWVLGRVHNSEEEIPVTSTSKSSIMPSDPSWFQIAEETVGFFFPRLLLVGCISWTVMVLSWPYALISPIIRPLEVMGVMSNYPWEGDIFFQGRVIPSAHLPMSYLPTWLLMTLPEFYFLGLVLGIGVAVYSCFQNRLSLSSHAPYLILIFSVLFPLLVIILNHSPVYDGMRHVMFVVPPLAILTAAGILGFWRRFPFASVRWVVGSVLGLTIGLVMYDIVTLHPYQTIYFNRLVAGGLKQALTRFDGDYWGQTYHAGSDWIVEHYPTESFNVGVPYMAKRLGYYFNRQEEIRSRRRMLLAYIHGKTPKIEAAVSRLRAVGPDWDGVSTSDDSLFKSGQYKLYMSGTQFKWNEKIPGKTLFSVSRQGVTLLEVKEVASNTSYEKVFDYTARVQPGSHEAETGWSYWRKYDAPPATTKCHPGWAAS